MAYRPAPQDHRKDGRGMAKESGASLREAQGPSARSGRASVPHRQEYLQVNTVDEQIIEVNRILFTAPLRHKAIKTKKGYKPKLVTP